LKPLSKKVVVCLEGLDGTGKTTIIRCLEKVLTKSNYLCSIAPEFPDGLAFLEINRALENSLFISESFEQGPVPAFFYLLYARTLAIIDILKNADIILIDRYLFSLSLYQGYFICDDTNEFNPVNICNTLTTLFKSLGLIIPDFTIVLDAPISELVGRLESRESRQITDNEKSILLRFRNHYLEYTASTSNTIVIDSSRQIDVVVNDVLKCIEKYIS